MRLICFWCAFLAVSAYAQEDGFYAPQTFRQHIDSYQKGLFTPAGRNDVTPQSSISEPWRPVQQVEPWRTSPGPLGQAAGPSGQQGRQDLGPIGPGPAPYIPKSEPWRLPYALSKEQQAHILHHKQALSADGNFRFEYASDNGLAAGETIEPDGSRVGGYQYKDPNGQVVKLKYRAGKDGFQILEGSHLPKSPEPVAPPSQDEHYKQAYVQQRQQYDLQQQYNQQRPDPNSWKSNQGGDEGQRTAGGQYFVQSWRPEGEEDDGQYRENEIDNQQNKGPHNFGEGYAFSFQG